MAQGFVCAVTERVRALRSPEAQAQTQAALSTTDCFVSLVIRPSGGKIPFTILLSFTSEGGEEGVSKVKKLTLIIG
jgi:hypothetical protein